MTGKCVAKFAKIIPTDCPFVTPPANAIAFFPSQLWTHFHSLNFSSIYPETSKMLSFFTHLAVMVGHSE